MAASSATESAIEAQGLCRRYGRRWALIDVSLHVTRGQVVMVAGRNGSGKSTLLGVLATALRADRGSGRVLGHDLAIERDLVRRKLGLLSHHSHLYPALTALENLEVANRLLGNEHSRDTLLARLAEVDLRGRAHDPVFTYSAGMRKRLSLCRTLLKDAELYLLDEPYAALDPEGFALVDSVLGRLRKRGHTVLVATHLLEHNRPAYDQGLVLDAGRLVWAGNLADLPGQYGLGRKREQEPGLL